MSEFYKPSLEIANIFKNYKHLLSGLSTQQHKVIQAILNCRTDFLGGHKLECSSCEYSKFAYNSCRNRHCPKCQFLTQIKWVKKREQELLPCPYFHIVFTVPSELRALFQYNQEVLYNLLFQASSKAIKQVSSQYKDIDIGCIGVLHTWAQNLINHPHIHFIVPGGGLSKNTKNWVACKQSYFLPIQAMSKVFKGILIKELEVLFNQGKLRFLNEIEHLKAQVNFSEFLIQLTQKEFVVYAKKPFAGASQVINYLGQYTHRIAISNYRLIKLEDDHVYFKVRDKSDPSKKKITRLHVKEFMRRYLLHVLPKAFVRIRHFGILGNRAKKEKIKLIDKITNKIRGEVEEVGWVELLESATGINPTTCPKCDAGQLKSNYFDAVLNTS
jgi:hypothetical protein